MSESRETLLPARPTALISLSYCQRGAVGSFAFVVSSRPHGHVSRRHGEPPWEHGTPWGTVLAQMNARDITAIDSF